MYRTTEDSRIQISELMKPSHANFGGKIHGGYILSLMDNIAFACASKHSRSYCVTASVNKVNFLNPIEVGELVTMKASVNYVGKSSMVVGIRVESENIRTGKVKHCNSSYFTMVAIGEDGKTVTVPGLILTNKLAAKRFIKSIIRKESDSKRSEDLENLYKNLDQHLEQLKNHRVKINFK
ncbi:acyl-CoA thioesterase [Winogradskyella echinorum]|uniref:Acyl-CoA thioesterase n=1 Tax=Winogradskyella echinorum TaxID=538189 RepID=A0ABR6Y2Z6_9FLAO|nr:acyl-CoA thioesterase [Winogradskyella echinorum]MBC3847121.1 acyl-CoA thioesterase [Winogradskyella echinorum]MBC5751469.1 acyl-CoA thioesterase [Winogradskyella echinorum]